MQFSFVFHSLCTTFVVEKVNKTEMKISKIMSFMAVGVAVLALSACGNKKFEVNGNIKDAKDSTLYFENLSLNGPVVLDSVKLGEDGAFDFKADATDAPEFYRLRIAGQIINVAIDSTETVKFNASYPTMSAEYEVEGSENCVKIRELAQKQLQLQRTINALVANPALGVDSVEVAVARVLAAYKEDVKLNYILWGSADGAVGRGSWKS